ncbi:hypothetical protein [Lysinibacillus odysseyi]|uniref:Uncharacterized protein n=2 Tax=Lysinibacillus odysseyi TaxID=202611 RepID=A0A0A3IVM3_9BACI|nr:hypothetical protein [Lysinibacillus odysseyi]KGR88804.1 hypothetical protein CD32_01095 [Lysinibacillus odysseyi 34hs-1 = NBRC 100172]
MLETNPMKEKVMEILQGDPLYSVICETPLEETLYTDSYLTDIIEKKFYSTPEVAAWFEITDAQLRYYIKPFEHYIFDDMADNPTTATVIRLNMPSILKLRMILLLKDEYRVKGLKRLLGIDENGYIVKQPAATTALAPPDELANKVEVLSNVLQQMMQTGLFHMQQDDESGAMQITINESYLAQNINLLSMESIQQLSEVQDRTEKLTEESKSLQKQITELKEENKKDIAFKIRERQIENEVVSTLRTEALEQFAEQKKSGIFAKLFRSAQVELEKERFINQYLAKHLSKRLDKALREYHESS